MLKAYYQTTILSKNGKLKKGRKKISKSFLAQYIQLLCISLGQYQSGGLSFNMLNTDGSTNTISPQGGINGITFGSGPYGGINYEFPMYAMPPEGSAIWLSLSYLPGDQIAGSLFGIVIGSSSTAVTPGDYALDGQVVHGTSTNQILYGGSWCDKAINVSSPSASYSFERMFNNVSGAGIVIKEIGIYTFPENFFSDASVPPTMCMVRDVITPITINNGDILKVRYTIEVSV